MAFNSIAFALFFSLVFLIYWFVLKKRLFWQNLFLLLASYVFYGWWDWRFLGLIVLSSLTDFLVGLAIGRSQNKSRRKIYLLLSLAFNLGMLAVFKYFDFFVLSFAGLLEQFGFRANLPLLRIVLPVGISFYTFQTLSYTIDVYRGQLQPTRRLVPFFAFVAFFPQLVAGPIERASHLLPQFLQQRNFDRRRAVTGCRLILWGLFKKVVIADRLALIVDPVYAQAGAYQGLAVWLATLAFAIQIYCDFSGYSDIAIGTARLLGFDLMENFRTPYLASSFREFWRRWHISLSTWFRDYVFIPLGGSRVDSVRLVNNLMITFLISGVWHGANFTFLLWGGLHGLLVSAEALNQRLHLVQGQLPNWIRILLVFLITCLAWIFFRAPSVADAFSLLGACFDLRATGWAMTGALVGQAFYSTTEAVLFGSFLLFFAALEIKFRDRAPELMIGRLTSPIRWGLYYLLALAILFLGQFDNAPAFIYFQF